MIFETVCPRCRGRALEECDLCRDTGRRGYKRCPRALVDLDALGALDMHDLYEAGHLPVPGGIGDQPAVFLSQERVIDSEMAAVRAEMERPE